MLDEPAYPIRVLLWLPPGMERSIVAAALRDNKDIMVVEESASAHAEEELEDSQVLRAIVDRVAPDVVITSVPVSRMRALGGDLQDTPTILLSSDGRSALTCERDLSAETLARLVRSACRRTAL